MSMATATSSSRIRYCLAFIAVFVLLSVALPLYLTPADLPYFLRPCTPQYHSSAGGRDDIRMTGAAFMEASQLYMDENLPANIKSIGRIPKIIHQSWKDGKLPNRFWDWSNSWRYHHPDWTWVLWTDADNDALVAQRHPELNETYWSLDNVVQRADFVRNLYMWDFGGLYADLDMNCLRSIDSVLASPHDHISPKYPIGDAGSEDVAIVGSMEAGDDELSNHAIPNAFMISSPGHPLWLLPLSRALGVFNADEAGRVSKGLDTSSDTYGTERTTGPIALYEAVLLYLNDNEAIFQHVHPALASYESVSHHHTVVLRPHIIYPFSWATESRWGAVYTHCRADKHVHFDPERCHELLQVYEKGSRTVTYWSHTWHQGSGGEADLSVAGQGRVMA